MKKINLGITGCMGRMGQQLIKSSTKNKNFKLVTLTENRTVNKKFKGIRPEFNNEKAFEKTDEAGHTTMEVTSFDYRFSNLCNFTCRMCGPPLSSSC